MLIWSPMPPVSLSILFALVLTEVFDALTMSAHARQPLPLQNPANESQNAHVSSQSQTEAPRPSSRTPESITRGRISAGGHLPSRLFAAGGTDQKTPLCDDAGDDE